MSGLTWDGTAEAVSRDQILRRELEQEKVQLITSRIYNQLYPGDPFSAECADYTVDTYCTQYCTHFCIGEPDWLPCST